MHCEKWRAGEEDIDDATNNWAGQFEKRDCKSNKAYFVSPACAQIGKIG